LIKKLIWNKKLLQKTLDFFKRNKRLGLAFGGGSARGIAHLGILKGLDEHQIPIFCIAGTSAGSIIGSLYAYGLSPDKIFALLQKLSWNHFLSFPFSTKGLTSSEPIESFINQATNQATFQNLKLPFCAVATDILSGNSIELKDPNMSVALAVRASSSFPGIFEPTKILGRYYFDGGASANIPVSSAKNLGANTIIAVDVIPQTILTKLPSNFATIADRGLDIILQNISNLKKINADLILHPVTKPISSFDIHKAQELFDLGYQCVNANIAQIKKLL
jgi:NTE family protein